MAESREGYALMQHWHDEANKLLSQALDLDQKGGEDKEAMIEFYSKGIANLKKAVEVRVDKSSEESEKLEKLRAKLSKNLELAQGRVKDLRERAVAGKKPAGNQKGISTSSQKQNKKPHGEDVPDCSPQEKMKVQVKGVPQHLVDIIIDEIYEKDTNISFEDIVGLKEAKDALKLSVIHPALNPKVFGRNRAKGLLLYGPPGNGKTMLARAVAHESSSKFLPVSASTLTSRYVGEGEKLVKALFAVARQLQPTIIFIDEVDSILTKRGSGEHDAMRRLKTEFLLQFQGMESSESDRLLVMAATNRPQDIDDAALRRFEARISIPLPADPEARKSILVNKLQKEPNKDLSEEDIDYIARKTKGYSNSDMKDLVNDAARIPLGELTQGLDDKSIENLELSQVRPILLKDFESALQQRKPSVSPETLRDLEEWAKKN